MDTQHCKAAERLSTGPLKPAGDWTGVFVRSDEAMTYAHLLMAVAKRLPADEVSQQLSVGLSELRDLLLSGFGK